MPRGGALPANTHCQGHGPQDDDDDHDPHGPGVQRRQERGSQQQTVLTPQRAALPYPVRTQPGPLPATLALGGADPGIGVRPTREPGSSTHTSIAHSGLLEDCVKSVFRHSDASENIL
jgi:hypothetical protein